jgi:hypothetical protein
MATAPERRRTPANPPLKRTPTRHRPGRAQTAEQTALVVGEDRPNSYNGVTVVSEEPIEHLKNKPFRISRLFLADGTIAFACRDCQFCGPSRGSVMAHRNAEHGARVGIRTPKVSLPGLRGAPDPILPEREDGKRPTAPMEMTLGEILSIAPSLAALGDLVEKLESERDAAYKELAERQQHDRVNQHKIDVYESLRSEVVDLRLQVGKQGNYEHVKEEMYALRAWKRSIIKRLSAVGFQLTEEDE